MTEAEWTARKLAAYGRHLESGLLTIQETVPAVLDLFAEVETSLPLWAGAPAILREQVLEYLARVGPDGLPPPFMIGPTDPDWRTKLAVQRREVAVKLLANRPSP